MTVFEGDGLFQESECGNLTTPAANETVRGEVVVPIISVIENGSESDNEVVTLTYAPAPYGLILMGGDRYLCARWNTSVNCGGGGWTTKDCTLHVTQSGQYQCRCLHQGTYTLLDVRTVTVTVIIVGSEIFVIQLLSKFDKVFVVFFAYNIILSSPSLFIVPSILLSFHTSPLPLFSPTDPTRKHPSFRQPSSHLAHYLLCPFYFQHPLLPHNHHNHLLHQVCHTTLLSK